MQRDKNHINHMIITQSLIWCRFTPMWRWTHSSWKVWGSRILLAPMLVWLLLH